MEFSLQRVVTWKGKCSPVARDGEAIALPSSHTTNIGWSKLGFKSALLHRLRKYCNTLQFVDVGANVGQTLLEVGSSNPDLEYFGFEPNPHAFTCLQELVEQLGVKAHLYPWACGDSSVPAHLYSSSAADDSATLIPNIRPDTYANRLPSWIARYTLDQSICLDSLTAAFVLKIDVEGGENEVLAGAENVLSAKRPLIICEVLHAHQTDQIGLNNARKKLLEAFLFDHKYEIYQIGLPIESRNKLLGISRSDSFPRDVIWSHSPHTCDYLFAPREYHLDPSIF